MTWSHIRLWPDTEEYPGLMMHLCVVDTCAGVAYVVIAALTVQNKVRICPSTSKLPVKTRSWLWCMWQAGNGTDAAALAGRVNYSGTLRMLWPHNQAVAASWEMKFLSSWEELSPDTGILILQHWITSGRHSRSWGCKNTGVGPHRLGRPGTELGVCWHKGQCVSQACWFLSVSLWGSILKLLCSFATGP